MENLAFVIEDNLGLSSIFSRALIAAGFQVESIYDGAIAQQRLKEASPRLVTLDMHLPHVDGATLLTQIRSEVHLKGTIVIVTTADSSLGEFNNHKADLLLEKPVSFSQLRDLSARYYKKEQIPILDSYLENLAG